MPLNPPKNNYNLCLVRPCLDYINSLKQAKLEYQTAPSLFDINQINWLKEMDIKDFINKLNSENQHSTTYTVPALHLWLILNKEYIGSFTLRPMLNDFYLTIGGHISYEIRPDFRHQNLAYQGVKLCMELLKKEYHLTKILITCCKKNTYSYQLIQRLYHDFGGEFLPDYIFPDHQEKRCWIAIP